MDKVDWQALLIKEGGLENYQERMAHSGVWGDGIMLEAAALLYKRPVLIVPSSNNPAGEQRCIHVGASAHCSETDAITLGYCTANKCSGSAIDSDERNHYVSLYHIDDNTADNMEQSETVTDCQLQPDADVSGIPMSDIDDPNENDQDTKSMDEDNSSDIDSDSESTEAKKNISFLENQCITVSKRKETGERQRYRCEPC